MRLALRRPAPLGNAARNIDAIRGRIDRVHARMPDSKRRLRRSDVVMLIAVIALFILVVGLAFDHISVIRTREAPRVVRSFFRFVSEVGLSQWELVPAAIVVLILIAADWRLVPRRLRVAWAEIGALTAFIFCSIAGSGIILNIIKQPIGRGRPPTFDQYGAFVLQPFRFTYNFQSFPSGHATTAGCLIAIGFLVVPRLRLPLLILGLMIAASRVMVGAHYPSDIVAGLLLGYVFSLWLAGRFANAGWAFARRSTGLIRARDAVVVRQFRSAAGIAVLFAGLVDALAGRRIWLPALRSIGDGTHDGIRYDASIGRDDPDGR